jgi:CheY-like chemotaxis protein
MNLVVNARDALPDGGKLTIETANAYLDDNRALQQVKLDPGDYILVSVSDTGTGMDEETQKHIFEPFYTTKEIGKGTGLGLSTAYGIVQQSGGAIEVFSELGRGTTFKIYLPRCAEDTDKNEAAGDTEQQLIGSETILLTEDEEMIRNLVREALEMNGYKVLEAKDGRSALALCGQYDGRIHLLVTDVIMPEMNGYELATRITKLRPELKLLYMSGYTDDSIARQRILDPDVFFLQKPFTPRTLVRKVREALDYNRQASEERR